MGASDIIGPLDDLVTILEMMLVLTELLVGEVGGDIEEGSYFGELFGEELHVNNYGDVYF